MSVILDSLVVFVLAFMWLLLASLQSRMLNHESTTLGLFVVAFVTSAVWVTIVRRVTITGTITITIAYSTGSALGVVVAKRLHVKYS